VTDYIPRKGDRVSFPQAPLESNRSRVYVIKAVVYGGADTLISFAPEGMNLSYSKEITELHALGMRKQESACECDPSWKGEE
jgi:hypothetical protein